MRRLGAVIFANQRRGGRGAISYFQGVIVDLSLEPGMTESSFKDICGKSTLFFPDPSLFGVIGEFLLAAIFPYFSQKGITAS